MIEPITSYISPSLEIWKGSDRKINLKVHGDSMSPLIRAGDGISLLLTQSDNLRLGDVVAFLENENIVVHRLIKKKEVNGQWWFCQKGDNLPGWSWVRGDQVLGRVESIQFADGVRNMGQWPWVWLNPIIAFVASLWITFVERGEALKILIFGPGPVPVLHRLNKGIFEIINRMSLYFGSRL